MVRRVEEYRSPDDAPAVALDLARLIGLVRVHLAQEDRLLYGAMIGSGSAHAAATARRFAAEMGGLAERIEAFAMRWSSSALIALDLAAFRAELDSLLAALDERIARENEQLYPLAEATGAIRPHAA
ncbi:hemerythrin domain-containing protein [Sphingomonas sp. ASV193]|uniref:hemerythrin domain-containing protein n=1 Tax=Sphingomonas sp. ASV193 TaxID=3144405 RepID=UPI0032E929B2